MIVAVNGDHCVREIAPFLKVAWFFVVKVRKKAEGADGDSTGLVKRINDKKN